MESYKELTCEFLASMRYHMYDEEIELIWTKDWDGSRSWLRERREWSKAAQIRSPVLRYVHKALANTFFARKATGTINEGELKFLDMGIKPISHAQAMARGSGEIDPTQGNLMPFLDHLQDPPTTLDINREAPKLDGHQVLQDQPLIEHKELDGRFQFKFTHPLVGPSKLLLPNPELTTVVRGENIDFRPPVYTLVGHEDLREEEPELDRAEDRAESS
ncbi:unnamed protein product [Microthlaspi erraticum]|uniref:Arabidopsis retrotransposon Orf1 C-terminal domain-containing protein n=1 Tax=Microthlaspi erraticum TaxID=1685480 RepID=A0A6D2JXH5_9BRAS|nr:unnamed protein product [Microthlaspi erraticum]